MDYVGNMIFKSLPPDNADDHHDLNSVQARLRYIERFGCDGSGKTISHKIDVRKMATSLYYSMALPQWMRDPTDFLEDMIQQMALVILASPPGKPEAYYRRRAWSATINYICTQSFDPEKEYFSSRKGYDPVLKRHRLVFTDDWEALENLFINPEEDSEPEDGRPNGQRYASQFQDDRHASNSPLTTGVAPWTNPLRWRNRGFWANRFSIGVTHLRFIFACCSGKLSPSDISLVTRLLGGEDIRSITAPLIETGQLTWQEVDSWLRRIGRTMNPSRFVPHVRCDTQTADSIRSFVKRFERIDPGDCSDLYAIRHHIFGSIRRAHKRNPNLSWGDIHTSLGLHDESHKHLAYEEYIRIMFERARNLTIS